MNAAQKKFLEVAKELAECITDNDTPAMMFVVQGDGIEARDNLSDPHLQVRIAMTILRRMSERTIPTEANATVIGFAVGTLMTYDELFNSPQPEETVH